MKENIERKSLELIQSLSRRTTQGHGDDCKCALCMIEAQATRTLNIVDNAKVLRSDVREVYSGIAHRCTCGCAGKYSESPREISRILNIINENIFDVEFEQTHVVLELGNRWYIAYFKES